MTFPYIITNPYYGNCLICREDDIPKQTKILVGNERKLGERVEEGEGNQRRGKDREEREEMVDGVHGVTVPKKEISLAKIESAFERKKKEREERERIERERKKKEKAEEEEARRREKEEERLRLRFEYDRRPVYLRSTPITLSGGRRVYVPYRSLGTQSL